jgi:hypothetical protein
MKQFPFKVVVDEEYQSLMAGDLLFVKVALAVLRESETARAAWEQLVGASVIVAEMHAE